MVNATETPGEFAPMNILVVDDNEDAADALVDILAIWGHEAWSAYDGESAVREATERGPDAVLLDIGLPDMDGYEVARRLREDPALAALKIIALTGYGQEDVRRRTGAGGFDGHLTKPIDLAALARLLTED